MNVWGKPALLALSAALTAGACRSSTDLVKLGPEQIGIEWVRVKSARFEIAKTLVTNKQYRACLAAGACPPLTLDCAGPEFSGDQQPVVCVSWSGAQAFSAWVGGRLPKESEWLYAASGGSQRAYPWGDEPPDCERAATALCGRKTTWPVCSLPAGNTPEGLCDMAGNVYEWIEDLYPNTPAADGRVDPPARVTHGGSWFARPDEVAFTVRGHDDPTRGHDDDGFRPVRELGAVTHGDKKMAPQR